MPLSFGNTDVLILENDRELDHDCPMRFEHHSIITQLRQAMNNSKLREYINKAHDHGCRSIYVFTTASDVGQIIEYMEWVSRSRIKTIHFDIRKHKKGHLDGLYYHAQKMGLTIQVNYV